MGLQRVRHDWVTELNWTELNWTERLTLLLLDEREKYWKKIIHRSLPFLLVFCPLFLCQKSVDYVSVQSLSCVRLFAIPWTAARQASLSITNSWSFLELIFIESVMISNHLILCHPLLILPLIFPSIRVFSNESALRIRWPKYWTFSFSISPSSEYSGLISCRMDWLDLLAVQKTLKSLLQHHSSKPSILRCSAFFIVQLYTQQCADET